MPSEEELRQIAKEVRRDVLEMVWRAGSGHLGGSLSCTEILVALYFGGGMRRGGKGDEESEGDRFILSAGHYCPALYAVLARAGYFPAKELATYGQLGSRLQSHPHNLSLPGIETSSGALGQGLSVGVGKALALKVQRFKPACRQGRGSKVQSNVFVLMSDGEQDEGQTWEAAMLAAKYKLDNLVAIIDKNGVQIDGTTEEIMPLGDLAAKYQAFGWETRETEGHEMEELIRVIRKIREIRERPKVIIAKTVFGKGVSFMEGNYQWHSRVPTKQELEKALGELK